jgi:hypothetical protein
MAEVVQLMSLSRAFTATAIGSYATTAALKALIGTTDSDDDAELGLICDRVNQFIESETKQPVCPISSATYLYDVDGPVGLNAPLYNILRIGLNARTFGLTRLYTPLPVNAATMGIGGFRAITLVEFATFTGDTFATIDSADYFLRDRHGVLGPYKWLILSDRPVGTFYRFPAGRGTVRITGTAGWAAIPDDLTRAALAMAQRDWNRREQGGQGVDSDGQPIRPPLLVTNTERETIHKYTLRLL